jgi:ankyrin repeat protein
VRLLLSLGHDSPTCPFPDAPASSTNVTTSNISLNEDSQTPLHLASLKGHSEIVHLLCASRPLSIPRRDKDGRDAIMLASQGGHDTVVQILLTFWPGGPEAALRGPGDVDGNTALHFASSNGHLLVLRTLLAAGADSERRNVWSWTAVAYSATVSLLPS